MPPDPVESLAAAGRQLQETVQRLSDEGPGRAPFPLRVFVGVFLIIMGIGWSFGMLGPWFLSYAVLAASSGAVLWFMHQRRSGDAAWVTRWLYWPGRLWKWFVVGVTGVAIDWRISDDRHAIVFAVVFLISSLLVSAFMRSRYRRWTRGLNEFYGMASWIFLVPWAFNSTVYLGFDSLSSSGFVAGKSALIRQWETLRTREKILDASGGKEVALLLSGGGYRAALTHAGMLAVLDEAQLPVRYLSTVSGGSIVGASYALGWSPHDFRRKLLTHRPAFANDFFNFFYLARQLTSTEWGTGEIYAQHLDRLLFYGRRIDETGPPELIANTTNYRDGRREQFSRLRPGDGQVATIVAASAAFPVAFDPVRVGSERYMDGGVVENLGVKGLAQYLELRRATLKDLPDVLLIADMSRKAIRRENFSKASLLQQGVHAQQVSFTSLHEQIYERYTNGQYDHERPESVLRQPYRVRASELWELPTAPTASAMAVGPPADKDVAVFVLAATSLAERDGFTDDRERRCIQLVADLDTLLELSPRQVVAAYWVGQRFAARYLERMCQAAQVPCQPVQIPPPPECPP